MRGLEGKKLIKYVHSVFLFSIYIYKTLQVACLSACRFKHT